MSFIRFDSIELYLYRNGNYKILTEIEINKKDLNDKLFDFLLIDISYYCSNKFNNKLEIDYYTEKSYYEGLLEILEE